MPMSLKCMIGKWLHKGQISQEEYDAVIKKLDGHDSETRADEIRKFAEWLVNKGVLGNRVIANGEITDYGKIYVSEYEKEKKNDRRKTYC